MKEEPIICRPLFHHNQRGIAEGQVSIPEQNEIVKELAGPSQPLLPASSKAASGSSKLRAFSSRSAVSDSRMMFDPHFCRIKDKENFSNS
jgi:hypothetical protein